MDTQRYDEMLENGTITQEEYDVLITPPPEPQAPADPVPEPPKPKSGSFFADWVNTLNGDDTNGN